MVRSGYHNFVIIIIICVCLPGKLKRHRTDKIMTVKLIFMLYRGGASTLAVTEAVAMIMLQTFSIGDKSGELGGQSSGGM